MSFPITTSGPPAGFEPHYLVLLQLTTQVRAAQRRFDKSRQSDDLKVAKKLEKQLDELLLKANHADNLQPGLFGSAKKPGPNPLF